MKNQNYFLIITFIILILSFQGFDNPNNYIKISKTLREDLSLKNENSKNLIWITFKDKGINADQKLQHPENFFDAKSIRQEIKSETTECSC
ncbi:MAG: hypothetical protein IPL16_07810 [Ignavibacteria bacterium]|nr:hypothetical protein [Ignavibacteria bacterium]